MKTCTELIVDAAINGSNGSSHVHRQWKLPYTSMGASNNFHGSKFTSAEASAASIEYSMKVGGNIHGSGLNGSWWTLKDVWWKQLEVCDTRGSRWKYVGIYGSSWQLPPHMVVEAAVDGSNESFHLLRQWKLISTSMEASTKFHRSKPTSIYFHGRFNGSKSTCMEVNVLPTCFHANWRKLLWN